MKLEVNHQNENIYKSTKGIMQDLLSTNTVKNLSCQNKTYILSGFVIFKQL